MFMTTFLIRLHRKFVHLTLIVRRGGGSTHDAKRLTSAIEDEASLGLEMLQRSSLGLLEKKLLNSDHFIKILFGAQVR